MRNFAYRHGTSAPSCSGNNNKDSDEKSTDGPTGQRCPECPTGADYPTCPTCETCPKPPSPPTCAQTCGSCFLCFHRADASPVCSRAIGNVTYSCDHPSFPACSSDNDCIGTGRPYCVKQVDAHNASTGTYISGGPICGTPGGVCAAISERCPA